MELDVEVCKEKWTCLRAQFRKLKRRMMQSSQNGTGTDEIYQPSWYAYEAMAFLNEAVECEGDTNTVDGNNTKYCTANTKPKPTLDEYAHSLSRENTLELVSIIEGLPVLWDRANRDNKYAKKADDAWKEVARKMSVDVDVCKEKWAAMRAQYRRIRGKVLQSTSKEGSGSDQIYRPSWYAYEAMTFLNRTMDYGKASNTTYRNIPEGTDATFVENNYFLSNENTLEFIAVVESHPLLWNKAHPDYGNVKRLEDTWQLVADEMDLDVEDCKDKWNSLRAQFRRLRRKILQSSEDAKESDQIYQPSWYAYDAMTFLTDVIQHGKARKRVSHIQCVISHGTELYCYYFKFSFSVYHLHDQNQNLNRIHMLRGRQPYARTMMDFSWIRSRFSMQTMMKIRNSYLASMDHRILPMTKKRNILKSRSSY
uniref:MADF domain-containing protein n=1 Tax=Anopheles merus TaxID=30066 RepID=A0A182UZV4_ANOME